MSVEQEIRFLGDVQRLVLNDGDVLVLSTERVIDDATANYLRGHLESLFPKNKILVLADGVRVGVLEKST